MAIADRSTPGAASRSGSAGGPSLPIPGGKRPGSNWQTAAREAATRARAGGIISGAGGVIAGGAGPDPGFNQLTPEGKLKSAQADLKSLQAQLKVFQAQNSIAKKKNKKHSGDPAIEKKIAALQKQIDALNKSIPDLENKYYVASGQYEKLLTGADRNAYLATQALFKTYGLESLAGKIYDYVKNGYDGATISLLLQDTDEYKTRFAGNELRKKNGLPVISAAEYLATESSFQQIMQAAGLPVGFYDQHSDFTDWIGKNVSPSEIQSRVDLASQATVLANPDYRRALNQMGIRDSDLTAYFLDPQKSLPFLQKNAATAAVGAGAIAHNLTFDQSYSEQLALQGVTSDMARQGYAQIESELDNYKKLGQIYGQDWNQREAEKATFEGDAAAIAKQRGLMSQERGAFGGASGGARAGLGGVGGAR